MIETVIAVEPKPFDTGKIEHRSEGAWAQIDEDRIKQLLVAMVDIPSPTGEEAAAGRVCCFAPHGAGLGLDAFCQRINDSQANAVGLVPKASGGGAWTACCMPPLGHT